MKSNYLIWDKIKLSNYSADTIRSHYSQGYLFTRVAKGVMVKTRSLRIKLQKFQESSENRRVLRKFPSLLLLPTNLPLGEEEYDWRIHKLGKYFFTDKFGRGTFSASKIKQLITSRSGSNFNLLLKYEVEKAISGYAICYQSDEFLHYAYPFYEFERYPSNFGMAMMLRAIQYSVRTKKQYVYLGSVSSYRDRYKLQFSGAEWFNGQSWEENIEELKTAIKTKGDPKQGQ